MSYFLQTFLPPSEEDRTLSLTQQPSLYLVGATTQILLSPVSRRYRSVATTTTTTTTVAAAIPLREAAIPTVEACGGVGDHDHYYYYRFDTLALRWSKVPSVAAAAEPLALGGITNLGTSAANTNISISTTSTTTSCTTRSTTRLTSSSHLTCPPPRFRLIPIFDEEGDDEDEELPAEKNGTREEDVTQRGREGGGRGKGGGGGGGKETAHIDGVTVDLRNRHRQQIFQIALLPDNNSTSNNTMGNDDDDYDYHEDSEDSTSNYRYLACDLNIPIPTTTTTTTTDGNKREEQPKKKSASTSTAAGVLSEKEALNSEAEGAKNSQSKPIVDLASFCYFTKERRGYWPNNSENSAQSSRCRRPLPPESTKFVLERIEFFPSSRDEATATTTKAGEARRSTTERHANDGKEEEKEKNTKERAMAWDEGRIMVCMIRPYAAARAGLPLYLRASPLPREEKGLVVLGTTNDGKVHAPTSGVATVALGRGPIIGLHPARLPVATTPGSDTYTDTRSTNTNKTHINIYRPTTVEKNEVDSRTTSIITNGNDSYCAKDAATVNNNTNDENNCRPRSSAYAHSGGAYNMERGSDEIGHMAPFLFCFRADFDLQERGVVVSKEEGKVGMDGPAAQGLRGVGIDNRESRASYELRPPPPPPAQFTHLLSCSRPPVSEVERRPPVSEVERARRRKRGEAPLPINCSCTKDDTNSCGDSQGANPKVIIERERTTGANSTENRKTTPLAACSVKEKGMAGVKGSGVALHPTVSPRSLSPTFYRWVGQTHLHRFGTVKSDWRQQNPRSLRQSQFVLVPVEVRRINRQNKNGDGGFDEKEVERNRKEEAVSYQYAIKLIPPTNHQTTKTLIHVGARSTTTGSAEQERDEEVRKEEEAKGKEEAEKENEGEEWLSITYSSRYPSNFSVAAAEEGGASDSGKGKEGKRGTERMDDPPMSLHVCPRTPTLTTIRLPSSETQRCPVVAVLSDDSYKLPFGQEKEDVNKKPNREFITEDELFEIIPFGGVHGTTVQETQQQQRQQQEHEHEQPPHQQQWQWRQRPITTSSFGVGYFQVYHRASNSLLAMVLRFPLLMNPADSSGSPSTLTATSDGNEAKKSSPSSSPEGGAFALTLVPLRRRQLHRSSDYDDDDDDDGHLCFTDSLLEHDNTKIVVSPREGASSSSLSSFSAAASAGGEITDDDQTKKKDSCANEEDRQLVLLTTLFDLAPTRNHSAAKSTTFSSSSLCCHRIDNYCSEPRTSSQDNGAAGTGEAGRPPTRIRGRDRFDHLRQQRRKHIADYLSLGRGLLEPKLQPRQLEAHHRARVSGPAAPPPPTDPIASSTLPRDPPTLPPPTPSPTARAAAVVVVRETATIDARSGSVTNSAKETTAVNVAANSNKNRAMDEESPAAHSGARCGQVATVVETRTAAEREDERPSHLITGVCEGGTENGLNVGRNVQKEAEKEREREKEDNDVDSGGDDEDDVPVFVVPSSRRGELAGMRSSFATLDGRRAETPSNKGTKSSPESTVHNKYTNITANKTEHKHYGANDDDVTVFNNNTNTTGDANFETEETPKKTLRGSAYPPNQRKGKGSESRERHKEGKIETSSELRQGGGCCIVS